MKNRLNWWSMLWRGACIILVLIMSTGCASYLAQKRLEGVAKGWCETIRASQVIPVYPLTEDLAVGDVFLVQTPISEQAKEYRKNGFLPLDDAQVRLPYTNFSKIYFDNYWQDEFGKTPHPVPYYTNGGPLTATQTVSLTDAPLPRAAFPSYSFQASSGGGFNAAFPIQGVPVALSYLNSQQVNGTVTISDARTYAGDSGQLLTLLQQWAGNPTTKDILAKTAKQAAPTMIFLRVVSRVYYARSLDVSLQRSGSQGESGKGGVVNDVQLANTNGAANTNYSNLLSSLTSMASTATSSAANAAQVGAAVKFTSASSSTVGLSQSFDHLLAIGYLGFDVPVYSNGALGVPVPTFQHAVLRSIPNPPKSPLTFDVSSEKDMADVSDAYHAAANQSELDGVINSVTGKANFVDLVRTGTPRDWVQVYYVFKYRGFIK